ncbi:MHYT domain-containing protein [Streptomyces sp. NBC_01497]|uniref:MHYT domain-containing protein n=1 Tax=Streptomyces sp. NBC_01497 TaxID=2903885 RepID=UPI002E37200A|nr:MHYT domain-containing protein [Streptomyces sp. NBC_01497]
MQGTVNGFSYGLVTPVVAFLMACLGGALGLRCAAPSLRGRVPWRPGVLVLATIAIGCGVWTMHFVAMTGFSVDQVGVGYDRPTMLASLGVGLLMIGAGLFVVGYRGATRMSLATGGTLTGLGIASMHYLGMAGLRIHGQIEYSTVTVVASVAVGVAASVAALYATARQRGAVAGLTAVACLGGAATGMHYLAMAGSQVHLAAPAPATHPAGGSDLGLLLPMLAGPVVFLVLAGLVMIFEPQLLSGSAAPRRTTAPDASRARTGGPVQDGGSWAPGAGGMLPAPRLRPRRHHPQGRAPQERAPQPVRRGSSDLHDW